MEDAATDVCDWCKASAADLESRRDYDEGMNGPVYLVCSSCVRRDNDAIRAEIAECYEDDYGDE